MKYFPLAGAPYSNIGPYGPRGAGFHYGVDLAAPTGTTIVAVDDGTVKFGVDPLGGNVAILHASDGRAWYFAHLSGFEGASRKVLAGEAVGYVGTSGNAAGGPSHVHVELWPSGSFQRPAPDPTTEIVSAPQLSAPLSRPSMKQPSVARAVALGVVIVAAAGAVAVTMAPPRWLRPRRRYA